MKILIIVPVYNEWPHLLPVLRELRGLFSDILVVDDGSTDKSFLHTLRQEGVKYLDLPFNLGHWAAAQAGFQYCLTRDYEGAITFDGDGQHIPQEIYKLLPLMENGADLVIGEHNDRGGVFRKGCRHILQRISGLEICDFTSGFRGYSRRAMERLVDPSLTTLEFQDIGVLLLAQRQGLKLSEIPVKMRERAGAKSKVFPDVFSVLRYLLITLTLIIAKRP